MRAIQPTFDLDASAAQSGTDLLAPNTPTLPMPADGVIRTHRTRLTHTENLLEPLLTL
ncbi:MAG TPA: hypothetical protein VHF01_17685 [Candidatus Acidoferrum sp.]|nr:hypothetical protein [Candidatus Acidoferrum sp.]